MEIRVIEVNGKKVKQYLRVCTACDDKAWKTYLVDNTSSLCIECSRLSYRENHSLVDTEFLPEDEDKNNAMIQSFLKNNKPSVTFSEDIDFKSYVPKEPLFFSSQSTIVDFDLKFPIALKKARAETNSIIKSIIKELRTVT